MIHQTRKQQEKTEVYYLASFSGGKDSTAMVLELIARGYPLDEVLCCDTTMEFPAMYRHIEKVRQVVEAAGVKFTVLKAEHDFEYYMLRHNPKRKNADLHGNVGYSWPGPRQRWCTRALKVQVINKYLQDLHRKYELRQYVGIAADEQYRLTRKGNQTENRIHPLADWGWTEAEALAYCYAKGFDWEGLYELFDRVSCWCCPLQPLSELRQLRTHFPELWQRLKHLDEQTWRDFKSDGQSVEVLDKRFALEDALSAAGFSIKNKAFYADMRRHCFDDVPIDQILRERVEASGIQTGPFLKE